MGTSRLLLFIVCGLLLQVPFIASAKTVACLGTEPAAAGDAQALDDLRFDVEAQCPCVSFTGVEGKARGDYVACAKGAVKAAIEGGTLRKQCRAFAKYPVTKSVCGYGADKPRLPCVHTSGSGKVTCKISSPESCANAADTACAAYGNCLDAADTNHDRKVGAGDSGICNPLAACLNPPLPDGTPCDDGDPCTKDDACSGRACTGTVYSCDTIACHEPGTCNGDGTCDYATRPDWTTCDAGTDAGRALTCAGGVCGPCEPAGACSVAATSCAFDEQCPTGETCDFPSASGSRFVDNDDGTITDRRTCLVWEKKDRFDDVAVACPGGASCNDAHDADNVFTWSSSATVRNGSVFTQFLTSLNDGAFAGHADWRLPLAAPGSWEELQSLVDDSVAGCGSGAPCTPAAFDTGCTPTCSGIDPTCSCTAPIAHWSANGGVSSVDFGSGTTGTTASTGTAAARAVRGCTPAPGGLPASAEKRCVDDCSAPCGIDGACVLGCDFSRFNDVDRCYGFCNGLAGSCLTNCLAGLQCLADVGKAYCL